MFYEIRDNIYEIESNKIDKNVLTFGCISSEELKALGKGFGLDVETIDASQRVNPMFRTGVDVHSNYTFAEMRIVNRSGAEDFISIYVKKNLLLIVDIMDEDNSTKNLFLDTLKKYSIDRINEERILYRFIEALLDGSVVSEEIRNQLTEMEEEIIRDEADNDFNTRILEIKRRILKYYNFYEQIMDIVETLEENDNEIWLFRGNGGLKTVTTPVFI